MSSIASSTSGEISTQGKVKEQSIYAVLTKADGTVIDYGMVSYFHSNSVICFLGNAWIWIRRTVTRK